MSFELADGNYKLVSGKSNGNSKECAILQGACKADQLRIAVISPFVDRRHGTERAVAELIERLAANYGDEVDLFAQCVRDVKPVDDSVKTSGAGGEILWHRVGQFPGPLLSGFRGWLWLNQRARKREARHSGKKP